MLSWCCDAEPWIETDLCSACKEHAEFYSEDNDEDDEICDKTTDENN